MELIDEFDVFLVDLHGLLRQFLYEIMVFLIFDVFQQYGLFEQTFAGQGKLAVSLYLLQLYQVRFVLAC